MYTYRDTNHIKHNNNMNDTGHDIAYITGWACGKAELRLSPFPKVLRFDVLANIW